jgi:hypothetical protein
MSARPGPSGGRSAMIVPTAISLTLQTGVVSVNADFVNYTFAPCWLRLDCPLHVKSSPIFTSVEIEDNGDWRVAAIDILVS